MMVVGEPGIGKTSIAEQLSTYVSLRGGKTLVGGTGLKQELLT